jgi:hypothetical protein
MYFGGGLAGSSQTVGFLIRTSQKNDLSKATFGHFTDFYVFANVFFVIKSY